MVCGPGGNGKRFIGGDAPFAMPSTTILPQGLMSSVTVPKAAAAGGGEAGSVAGKAATVGVLGAPSTVFVSATGGVTVAGDTGAATGSGTGATGAGVGSVFT